MRTATRRHTTMFGRAIVRVALLPAAPVYALPVEHMQHHNALLIVVVAAALCLTLAHSWIVHRYGQGTGHRKVALIGALKVERERRNTQDDLTGLPNRCGLLKQLQDMVNQCAPHRHKTALLILDFKNLKLINDGLGHEAGDAALRAFAMALRGLVSHDGVVARLGSDEFAVAMTFHSDLDDVEAFCRQALAMLRQPVQVVGQTVSLRPSIGIAVSPQDGDDAETLLRKAYAALQSARLHTEASYLFYDPYLHREKRNYLDLRLDMSKAIRSGQMHAYFQPTWDLRTGALVGAEALVRWLHPGRGLLMPSTFMAIAESDGLTIELGSSMLDQVLRHLSQWHMVGLNPGPITINLSMSELREPGFVESLRQKLHRFRMPADRLCFEITESAPMRDDEIILAGLHGIRALGCGLLLDDFGTGYSSLNHLRHLPVGALKIDQSYVSGAQLHPTDRLITEAIVGLARGLGLKTVAEGVETEAQVRWLRDIGCDLMQGFLYGRPMTADDFAVQMRTNATVALPVVSPATASISRLSGAA